MLFCSRCRKKKIYYDDYSNIVRLKRRIKKHDLIREVLTRYLNCRVCGYTWYSYDASSLKEIDDVKIEGRASL